jgi:hypothetical protein
VHNKDILGTGLSGLKKGSQFAICQWGDPWATNSSFDPPSNLRAKSKPSKNIKEKLMLNSVKSIGYTLILITIPFSLLNRLE